LQALIPRPLLPNAEYRWEKGSKILLPGILADRNAKGGFRVRANYDFAKGVIAGQNLCKVAILQALIPRPLLPNAEYRWEKGSKILLAGILADRNAKGGFRVRANHDFAKLPFCEPSSPGPFSRTRSTAGRRGAKSFSPAYLLIGTPKADLG
jgi:hypothetical protein